MLFFKYLAGKNSYMQTTEALVLKLVRILNRSPALDTKMNTNHDRAASTQHPPSQRVETGEAGSWQRKLLVDSSVHAADNIENVDKMAYP